MEVYGSFVFINPPEEKEKKKNLISGRREETHDGRSFRHHKIYTGYFKLFFHAYFCVHVRKQLCMLSGYPRRVIGQPHYLGILYVRVKNRVPSHGYGYTT